MYFIKYYLQLFVKSKSVHFLSVNELNKTRKALVSLVLRAIGRFSKRQSPRPLRRASLSEVVYSRDDERQDGQLCFSIVTNWYKSVQFKIVQSNTPPPLNIQYNMIT